MTLSIRTKLFLALLGTGTLVAVAMLAFMAWAFERGLLEHPHYTRPREFRGLTVPDPLLSGHHERIRRFRRERQFEETARHRPDLLERFVPANAEDRTLLERVRGDRVAGRPRNS